jgi:hypothetical protein
MEELPMGFVLGTVVVEGCRAIDSEFMQELGGQEETFGWYGPGRFAWFLREPEPLPMPVAVRGGQGLWNWTTGCQ